MKFFQTKGIVLAISLVLILCACGASVKEIKVGSDQAKHNLVIAVMAGKASEFKDNVIQGLIERYNKRLA